jgi:hypothetical protein
MRPNLFTFSDNCVFDVWFVAFPATLYNKIFSSYQPCQLVKTKKPTFQGPSLSSSSGCWCVWRTSPYHTHTHTHTHIYIYIYISARVPCLELGQAYIWHELVLQTHQHPEEEDRDGPWNLVFSPFNQLTLLVVREYFIIILCSYPNPSCVLHALHIQPFLQSPYDIRWGLQSTELLIVKVSPAPRYFRTTRNTYPRLGPKMK